MKPVELVAHYRTLADSQFDDAAAKALRFCADSLEAGLKEADGETVNLRQAALLSGFSEDHLGRLVRDGKIPNAGRAKAPLIRVSDLPSKPGRPLRSDATTDQLAARRIAESVTTPRKGRA